MSSRKTSSPRAWQRMLSGRRLDLIDPSPMDIEIEDIAHGLARVARWNGQTRGDWTFSVAQHSVMVERLFARQNPDVARKWRLACLLHDAPEYVIGDMITPFKAMLSAEYGAVEQRLEAAVHIRFGLPGELPETIKKAIKRADKLAAYLEAVQLAGFSESEARANIARPRVVPNLRIKPQPPREAAEAYLRRFRYLGGKTT
ncbi:MAG: HD family hydrolase [Alphaproteobacteria bacterium]|nr:HD family hydrolase [Alphaproteobacteria bacterium]